MLLNHSYDLKGAHIGSVSSSGYRWRKALLLRLTSLIHMMAIASLAVLTGSSVNERLGCSIRGFLLSLHLSLIA